MIAVDNCPLCGGDGKHWELPTNGHEPGVNPRIDEWLTVFKADRCPDCGTIYQNPRYSNLEEYYSSGKYREEHPSDKQQDERRAERILNIVERFKVEPKSCLDVGCGRGELLKLLEIYFFARVLGLEYDPEIPEIEEVVQSKDDVEGTFDLITCIHVMEHMPHPVEELEWMLSKLNPGGTIIIEVPIYIAADMSHLWVADEDALRKMLDKLNLDYLYIEDGKLGIILIGDNYSKYTVEKVYYSYDSPDFSSPLEYANWLRGEAYEAERNK